MTSTTIHRFCEGLSSGPTQTDYAVRHLLSPLVGLCFQSQRGLLTLDGPSLGCSFKGLINLPHWRAVFTIRILAGGEPLAIAPVEMYFNGATRIEDFTNDDGEIIVQSCPWQNVHVIVAGVPYGVHNCYDGGEVEVEVRRAGAAAQNEVMRDDE